MKYLGDVIYVVTLPDFFKKSFSEHLTEELDTWACSVSVGSMLQKCLMSLGGYFHT